MNTPNDIVQRFLFEKSHVRGEIVHLGESFQTILKQHAYPVVVQNLLGEALVATVLLVNTIKFRGELTIQFQSQGPLTMLVAKCNHLGHIRAMAHWKEGELPDNSDALIGDGQLVVTIAPFDKVQPYQSIVPLQHHSISEALEFYFAQSEQIPSRLWFGVGEGAAAGMLLQMLPSEGEENTQEREYFWEHASKLGETITTEELLTLDNQTILHRLYHQDAVRLFEAHPVQFKCTCSVPSMEDAVRTFGQAEAEAILAEQQRVVVTCEYCNNEYAFGKDDIHRIFST